MRKAWDSDARCGGDLASGDSRPCPEPYYNAQDDAERALEQPLVSLSVGCDAIFLIGGAHRDVPPTALLLRSGDVLVMAGETRGS